MIGKFIQISCISIQKRARIGILYYTNKNVAIIIFHYLIFPSQNNIYSLFYIGHFYYAFSQPMKSSRQYKVLDMDNISGQEQLSPRTVRRLTASSDDNDVVNDLTYQRVSIGLLEDPDIKKVGCYSHYWRLFTNSIIMQHIQKYVTSILTKQSIPILFVISSRSHPIIVENRKETLLLKLSCHFQVLFPSSLFLE